MASDLFGGPQPPPHAVVYRMQSGPVIDRHNKGKVRNDLLSI